MERADMDQDAHDRLVALEEKLSFVERHVGELDGLVRELFERMDGLKLEVSKVRDDVHRQLEDAERRPEDDQPPHWAPPA